MSLLDVRFYAESLHQQASMNVILPASPGPFGVLYLLHGLSDDHTIWLRRTSIERYVAERHIAVVMPSCLRGWYCNDDRLGGLAYEDHIVKDVVGFMDNTFHTIGHRGGRAIAGLSMGGFGSMMLAMRHADMFSVASSHSGAMEFLHADENDWIEAYKQVYSSAKYNLFDLAKASLTREPLAIRMDCGKEDFLIEPNRRFHRHLQDLKISHEYHEYPGAHTWDYWDLHVQETIEFVMANLAKE